MPTYDLQCDVCSHEFEEMVPMSGLSAAKCPKCGSRARQMFKQPPMLGWRTKTINVGADRMEIGSRKQHREELWKRGIYDPNDDVGNPLTFKRGVTKREKRDAVEKHFRQAARKVSI